MCVQAAELQLILSQNTVEMGKYISGELIYHGDTQPDPIDLDLWRKDFHVDIIETSTEPALPPHRIRNNTRLRLYPRREGDLTLEAIAAGGAFIKPVHIKSLASVRNHIDANPTLLLDKRHYWTDEVITVSFSLNLHHQNNRLVAQDWELPGFKVVALKPRIMASKNGFSARISWQISTASSGVHWLELPVVEQRGRGRFQYFSPRFKITVKPLPAFMPPSVPVGQIKVKSNLGHTVSGKKAWIIEIANSSRLPQHIEGLQNVLDKMQPDRNKVKQTSRVNQLSESRRFEIPVPDWSLGRQHQLQLPFFNTHTGRVDYINHKVVRAWHIPVYARIALLILLVVSIFYLVRLLAGLIQRYYRYRNHLKKAKQCENAQALRHLILKHHDWKYLQPGSACSKNGLPPHFIDLLNRHCFARSQPDDTTSLIDIYCQHLKPKATTWLFKSF